MNAVKPNPEKDKVMQALANLDKVVSAVNTSRAIHDKMIADVLTIQEFINKKFNEQTGDNTK